MGRAFLAVQGSQAVSWSKMSAAFSRERSYFWLRMRSTRLRLLAWMVFLSAAISSSVSGALGRLRPGGVGLAGGRPG